MMKRYCGMAVSIVTMLLISGCQGWFNVIPKDTVMVKEIIQEQKPDEIDYEGVLSQSAAESLGLNAVNKYFGQKLQMEQAQFEVAMIDQAKLKELYKEASIVAAMPLPEEMLSPERPSSDQSSGRSSSQRTVLTSDISAITKGLYYVTLTTNTAPMEYYEIVLNAKDGDVLRILRSVREPQSRSLQQNSKFIDVANRFIEEHGSYPLSELKYQTQLDRSTTNLELYYTSKDDKTMRYCIVVDPVRNEVIGFSKNIMAFFSYTVKQSFISAPSPAF